MTMNYSRFLALPLDAQKLTQQLNLQQQNRLGLVLHGEQDQQHSTGELCWVQVCIYFGFYFMSPNGPELKLLKEFLALLWSFCVYSLYRSCTAITELAMQFS